MPKNFKRTTVTAALPYANGPLHIGHIAGAYLPSDIYVRYLRLKGEDVIYVCGSDEHGVAIQIGARKEGVPPKQFVDKYHELMKNTFEAFGISFDIYSRTTHPVHYQTAQEFFTTIHQSGIFREEVSEQYYDEQEGLFLADRYIVGTCPVCGYDRAYGDQCEKCGTSLSPKQLINPRSTVSGNPPVLKPTRHWYFPLDEYEDWLREWLLKGHAHDWKTNVYGQCKSWIEQGLQARSITRDMDWGVPVPLPDAKGKVLYVWFDAPIGYISATKELKGSEWEKYWKDPDTRLIHFIGKDNIVFHCIIFPCMLKAEGSYILPDNVPANEFLNLEGDKISTSRNHAVWLHEYLRDFPGRRDELRYVLTSIAPETKDSDFTWKDYQQRVNSELVGILGNFVNRVLVLIAKYFNHVVPALPAIVAEQRIMQLWQNTEEELNRTLAEMVKALEEFRFREAQFQMMNLARAGNKWLADTEPWKRYADDKAVTAFILHQAMRIVATLGFACEPFLPDTAKRIQRQINFLSNANNEAVSFWKNSRLLALQQNIMVPEKADLLFTPVPDEQIETQLERLKKKEKTMDEPNQQTKLKPLKPQISIDDFAKLDIRIGKVISAERVEKSDKLLKLVVDTGIDKRTILSGIARHYSPEELVGRQVTLLANLAPRKMMGIESQGMILTAENPDGTLRLIQSADEISPGATIS
ncbi:MAG: methionine--tRNA ligase [Cyclobacteriaceae bacterium]|nr:methionine--tRNA ligase [Cyclobacteriaceae bacterium]MDW8331795.1 methionine--tRNA ligase [Cyclobacteriaceae bacterium]